MEVQELVSAVEFARPSPKINEILREGLSPAGRGIFSLSLHLLKQFEDQLSERRIVMDFTDKSLLRLYREDGKRLFGSSYFFFPHAHKKNAILLGSLMVFGGNADPSKPVEYENFKTDVISRARTIYRDFIGMPPQLFPDISYSHITEATKSNGIYVNHGVLERGYSAFNRTIDTIRLLLTPGEITIGDISITPGMYSIRKKVV